MSNIPFFLQRNSPAKPEDAKKSSEPNPTKALGSAGPGAGPVLCNEVILISSSEEETEDTLTSRVFRKHSSGMIIGKF